MMALGAGPVLPNNRIVITGGPGAGKTTLVNAMKALGYKGFSEIARDLMQMGIHPPDMANAGHNNLFFDIILKQRIKQHQEVKGLEIAFYDRGMPDSLAYLRFRGMKIPDRLKTAIRDYPYHPVIFVMKPWKEFYQTDAIRTEPFEIALELHELGVEAYRELGYEVVELPLTDIRTRVNILLDYLDTKQLKGK